jgi:hypothetical protein
METPGIYFLKNVYLKKKGQKEFEAEKVVKLR